MSTTLSTTAAVLGQHLQALMSRDLDAIMADYADEAVVFSPNGMFKGRDAIRGFFTAALDMLTPEAMSNLKPLRQDIDGEFAYVLWSAQPVIPFAGDTFCVHEGKITLQSFVPAGA